MVDLPRELRDTLRAIPADIELDRRLRAVACPQSLRMRLKETVANLRGGADNGPLMEMSEVVIKDDVLPVTVWAWWNVPDTPIAGSALVKVGEEGVISERLAYHTALAG